MYDEFNRPVLDELRFEGRDVMPDTPQEAWEKVCA